MTSVKAQSQGNEPGDFPEDDPRQETLFLGTSQGETLEQPAAWDELPGSHPYTYCRVSTVDEKLWPIEHHLQCLLKKVDEFQMHLLYSRDRMPKEGFTEAVLTFFRSCQPYFAYLESTARSVAPSHRPLPQPVRTRLLQFSHLLCSRLEQLVLMYASLGLLSLEETDPCSLSQFHCGEVQLGPGCRVSAFRYCRPSPFHAGGAPGPRSRLYKCVRWNVERAPGRSWREAAGGWAEGAMETGVENEYYFLCCELPAGGLSKTESGGGVASSPLRPPCAWSIGQWVQIDPDPERSDIYDWVLCVVPRGEYRPLLFLGEEEPTVSTATDYLLGLLLRQGLGKPGTEGY
nr:PREDICTED: UPF0575 protein C19orf67 homolog isoform X1 [Lepisosteus oculatus]XP_015204677.1 PREDICTED: UPF0575 protein C19orf67 homolog isoform X1 [Lepisosteus oculatus]XP_015204678.1 PREDICTED: UPF0575 protein C19orf67 homolog isoform X1 [Lepisosteus oculatus]XP_015204679.1 PREDICTED: UPF0575 protein C19orf67 homolog isoform X1 [Lepisosteus oculatus]